VPPPTQAGTTSGQVARELSSWNLTEGGTPLSLTSSCLARVPKSLLSYWHSSTFEKVIQAWILKLECWYNFFLAWHTAKTQEPWSWCLFAGGTGTRKTHKTKRPRRVAKRSANEPRWSLPSVEPVKWLWAHIRMVFPPTDGAKVIHTHYEGMALGWSFGLSLCFCIEYDSLLQCGASCSSH
jgi:hypothetical protein